jgi:hypothetical protein
MSTTTIILINAVFWSAVLIAIVGGLLKAIVLDHRANAELLITEATAKPYTPSPAPARRTRSRYPAPAQLAAANRSAR